MNRSTTRLLCAALITLLFSSSLMAQSLGPAPGNSTTPTGAAGGDLSGSYPNPVAAKINGNSVPSGVAADQILVGTAANTLSLGTIPDCLDTSGKHLNYAQSSHLLSCGVSGGSSASGIAYASGQTYAFGPAGQYAAVAMSGNRIYCVPATVRSTVTITALGTRVTAAAATGNFWAGAIYANAASGNPRPGVLVIGVVDVPASTITSTSFQTSGTLASATTLQPNTLYWQCSNSSAGLTVAAVSPGPGYALTSDPILTGFTNFPVSSTTGYAGVFLTGTGYTTTAGTFAWPSDYTSTTFSSSGSATAVMGFTVQ